MLRTTSLEPRTGASAYDTTIRIDNDDGTCIVRVACDVDAANAEILGRYIHEASAGADATIVALDECGFIDSSGLNALMEVARGRGDRFSIVVPPGTHMRKIFRLTGLDESLDMRDSIAAARTMRQRKPARI